MFSQDEFAEKIKSKYPEYQSIDNTTLVQKILEKYPEYKSQVVQQTKQTPVDAPIPRPQGMDDAGYEQMVEGVKRLRQAKINYGGIQNVPESEKIGMTEQERNKFIEQQVPVETKKAISELGEAGRPLQGLYGASEMVTSGLEKAYEGGKETVQNLGEGNFAKAGESALKAGAGLAQTAYSATPLGAGINFVASEYSPEIEQGLKTAFSSVGNISDFITGQKIGTTNEQVLSAIHQSWGQLPDNVKEDLGNLVMIAPIASGNVRKMIGQEIGKTLSGVGEYAGKLGGALEKKATQQIEQNALDTATKLVTPELKGAKAVSEIQQASKTGRLSEGGLFTGAEDIASNRTQGIADEVSKLEGITGSNYRKDLNTISKAQNIEAQTLEQELKKVPLQTTSEVGTTGVSETYPTALQNIRQEVAQNLEQGFISETAKKYTNDLLNEFERLIKTKNPQTVDDLWKIRQDIDSFAQSKNKDIMSVDYSPKKEALDIVRDSINKEIEQGAEKVGVRQSWNKWSKLQQASDVVAQKAVKQASSSIGRLYQTVKDVLEMKGTLATVGLGGAGAYMTGTLPAIAGLSLVGGAGYGAYKLATSPTLKKGLAKLLKLIEKALPKATPEQQQLLLNGKKEIQLLLEEGKGEISTMEREKNLKKGVEKQSRFDTTGAIGNVTKENISKAKGVKIREFLNYTSKEGLVQAILKKSDYWNRVKIKETLENGMKNFKSQDRLKRINEQKRILKGIYVDILKNE